MSITLDTTTLNYITDNNKFIITFVSAYNDALTAHFNILFNNIFPNYSNQNLTYSNACKQNTEFICKHLKDQKSEYIIGKLIIVNWLKRNIQNRQSIESVYGKIGQTMDSQFHALAYLEITIEDIIYYIAIESTICNPYKLQFYVGSSPEEFKNIITTRYQCKDFKTSLDCERSWIEISYQGGRTKMKKLKKTKRTKRTKKTKKTKRTKKMKA